MEGQTVAAGFAGAGALAALLAEAVLLEDEVEEEALSESFFAAALYESLR